MYKQRLYWESFLYFLICDVLRSIFTVIERAICEHIVKAWKYYSYSMQVYIILKNFSFHFETSQQVGVTFNLVIVIFSLKSSLLSFPVQRTMVCVHSAGILIQKSRVQILFDKTTTFKFELRVNRFHEWVSD